MLGDGVAALLCAGEEENRLLDVGGEMEKVHDLAHTGTGDLAQSGEGSIVGANALVPYHKKFPPRSLITGVPARLARELTEEEITMNEVAVKTYRDLVEMYRSGRIIKAVR